MHSFGNEIIKPHECGFWNSTRQVRHDIVMTLCQRSHDIMSTCPTIRMTSLRIHADTDATVEICTPHMLYLIFLLHPARSPYTTGRSPWSYFVSFLWNISRLRISFARKGILLYVHWSDFDWVFLLIVRKFGVCTLEITDLGHGINVFENVLHSQISKGIRIINSCPITVNHTSFWSRRHGQYRNDNNSILIFGVLSLVLLVPVTNYWNMSNKIVML
jgi:hypothetical protein